VKPPTAFAPALLAFLLAGLGAGDARATDDKEVCVRAVEHAQNVRLDGKLREAREGFMTCARAVCPDAIRQDCTRWITEVDASLPSVVFEGVWADGRDVTGMTVWLDGKSLAGAEPGRAVALDPGEHTFRFDVSGAASIETRNVVREGEKNRILRVTFTPNAPSEPTVVGPPAPATTTSASYAPPPPRQWQPTPPDDGRLAPAKRGSIPVTAFVFGGVGLASFGGFAVLALTGTSRLDSMRTTCEHTFNPSDVTSARNEILVGDILGYVGLAAAGVALWLALR